MLDLTEVTYCDGAGLALLVRLRQLGEDAGCRVSLAGLSEPLRRIVEADTLAAPQAQAHAARPVDVVSQLGRATIELASDIRDQLAFAGELTANVAVTARTPRAVRWQDALRIAESAGVDAVPITGLVGFLLGLILGFQASVPLRLFGADIYVAGTVGVSIIRELGPLMTAIILAGRTGSAFAAEISAMRLNEETDALTTMGIDPVRFLSIPRLLAATTVAPLLTLFADLAGLIGGLLVMLALGFPPVVFWNQIVTYVHLGDLMGGLFKAVVFGLLVSAVGCQRGLSSGYGPDAVGRATTRAVVSGIVMIAIADGLFAVTFHCLGI